MPGLDESLPADLAALRTEFPGWTFGTVWTSVASGPDARRVWAMKSGFLLSAWTAEELAAQIYRIAGP